MIRAFVSSTYRDLKDHRAYVIERLARSGIFLDPMEKWAAASDEPKTLSQERVRECQLCILLVGFRRGHVPEGESRSITQLEYSEALRRGLTVLVFLADEQADWPAESLDALENDPEIVRWRSELREHEVVGFFGPRPESIDVDAAVSRWLQQAIPDHSLLDRATFEDERSIDIRAHRNSEGVLIAWRTERPIGGCLGFALYRQILGDAGIATEIVTSRLSFGTENEPAAAAPQASTKQPIQRFRWIDPEQREVRYRVAPVIGTPGNLLESVEETGSAWTPWLLPHSPQDAACRAFFNRSRGSLAAETPFRRGLAKRSKSRSADGPAIREYLGGGLRKHLLNLLSVAHLSDRRVYAALTDLDDPDLIEGLKSLGSKVHLLLPARIQSHVWSALSAASVHIYRLQPAGAAARSNFAVSCDRWGTPLSISAATSAWTIDGLCVGSASAVYVESTALARAYLDRWDDLRDAKKSYVTTHRRHRERPAEIREHDLSITVWSTPRETKGELRDAIRVIRGARQGVLFLLDRDRAFASLVKEAVRLAHDRDLFVEGLLWSDAAGSGNVHFSNGRRYLVAEESSRLKINSTIVLVDAFGPHPVVMTGSHDLSAETSAKKFSELMIMENAPTLAAEYAVHLIAILDRSRFRRYMTAVRALKPFIGLSPTDAWQKQYFSDRTRREFNFLFGSLSPGT